MCLSLPWEVIERVIDHSADSITTLYSFTLTCRDLHPRSTMHFLHRVEFKNRAQILDLCDVLQAKPHLQACVRSVSIPFDEFSPYPLLRMLPRLSEIEFGFSRGYALYKSILLHSSVLHYCRHVGQHIRTLSLHDTTFRSLSDFLSILLSFSAISSLSCRELKIELRNDGLHGGVSEDMITRLSRRLNLQTLAIHTSCSDLVLALLVEGEKHKLATLTCVQETYASDYFDKMLIAPSDWVNLTSLTWRTFLPVGYYGCSDICKLNIKRITGVLNDFHPTNLREVTAIMGYNTLRDLVIANLPSVTEERAQLEEALTAFSAPTILFSPRYSERAKKPLNGRRYHSWMHILGTFFPLLAKRRGLRLDAELWNAGHDGLICTPIAIWDLESRCISQEWFIEDYDVDCLAFSPCGQYIVSTGAVAAKSGLEATIWDIHDGGRKVRSLTGKGSNLDLLFRCVVQVLPGNKHANSSFDPVTGYLGRSMRCAWSSDGRWIVAGPHYHIESAHIWETTTFQRLHPHATWEGKMLAVSSDGHLVVTAVNHSGTQADNWDCSIRVWNVETGKLHQYLMGRDYSVGAAAFDQGSRRIVTGSGDSTIRIWDVESGEHLLVLKGPMRQSIDLVAFSGDGRMVLSCWVGSNGGTAVWDASSGVLLACLSHIPTTCFEGTPYATCISPCGSYLVSGSQDREVLLWKTSDWSCVAQVPCGRARMTHVAFSPDGRVLCCGTEDGAVFLHRMHELVSTSQD